MTNNLIVKSFEVGQLLDDKAAGLSLGKQYPVIWNDPLMLGLSVKRNQYLIASSYGVVALTNWSEGLEKKAEALLRPFVRGPLPARQNFEDIKVVVDSTSPIKVFFQKIILSELSEKFLLIIGMLLNQSVGLESYEKRIDPLLNQFAAEMHKLEAAKLFRRRRTLLSTIHQVMRLEYELVTNLEILDKPDLTWEEPGLDFLYRRFADELELPERTISMREKIDLLRENSKVGLDLSSAHRGELLEIAIVALFIIDIILILVSEILKRT